MDKLFQNVVAAILAGGKSRRMGQDKRFLDVAGRPLIQRVLQVVQGSFPDAMIVGAESEPALLAFGVPVITDIRPGYATLGGLYTALKRAGERHVFAVAADMPCVDPRVIALLVGRMGQADVVVAALPTGLQPMHAIYGPGCVPIIERMMDEGDLTMQHLLQHPALCVQIVEDADLRSVDPQLRSFLNINTPADLEMVRKLLAPPHVGSSIR